MAGNPGDRTGGVRLVMGMPSAGNGQPIKYITLALVV